ncbi:unnamed protein product [Prunus brigantina]
MLSLSSSPPFVFYFLLVFRLFHVVFLLLVLIKVDSKTSPSCLSSFLSFFVLCSFVLFSVLCRKTKRDHSITNPCGIDLALTYLNYQRFVHLRVKTCI